MESAEVSIYDAMVMLLNAGRLPIFLISPDGEEWIMRYYYMKPECPLIPNDYGEEQGDSVERERILVEIVYWTGLDIWSSV
jgi:hypothetical protein